MTEAISAQGDAASSPLARLADLGTMLRRSDIALAIGMMTILVVLIVPLPPLLLDFSLAVSITFSVLILMTSLFIQAPLEFSAFPTVLLIATMLRLSLNLASTRLILAHGHEDRRRQVTSSRRSAISSWVAISSSASSCSRSWRS
jgi:flagellar biosynthesis protein FlhA